MSKIFVIPAILFGSIVWIGIGMWMAPHSFMLALICCTFGPLGVVVAVVTNGEYPAETWCDRRY